MIVMREVSKIYQMGDIEVHALRGLSFSMEEGEFVAVMGPSGSGKSTLMNIAGCLDRPTGGYYTFCGREIEKLKDVELARIRREQIGFVFQTFNLLPRFTARANVELPMIYGGLKGKVRKQRAMEVLKDVGLKDRCDHRPGEMSGGQSQRVAIARALVNRPSLILADEPTGSLDTKTGGEIMEVFSRLNREGMGILLVTHEPHIAKYADRTVVFRDGIIVEDNISPGNKLAQANISRGDTVEYS